MKVTFFSTKDFEKPFFEDANEGHVLQLHFLEAQLNEHTADLAKNSDAICIFVNDKCDAETLKKLAALHVKYIALRSAGYNHVDLKTCQELGIKVARVPAYSPYSVAEHTIALIQTLNRKTHRAYNRVKEGNFSLEGLMGFDLHEKTVGLIGLGKIGKVTAQILKGFGCTVLGHDTVKDEEWENLGIASLSLKKLLNESDIVSLHCPLTPETHHLINQKTIAEMKKGIMLINTSRGGLVDTQAVIDALKTGQIGYLGLDVYEEEADLFFEDLSEKVIQDDVFSRLLTFPNVLITGHQAFLTKEAVQNIAGTTIQNLIDWQHSGKTTNDLVEIK